MFGSSFQKPQSLQPLQHSQQQQAGSMFSSNSTAVPNQVLQQQQQQQQQQKASRFEKYELHNIKEHNLFAAGGESDNSPSTTGSVMLKKRTIPKKLVKRISKIDNSTDETDKPPAPILPFKASTQFQADTFNDDFAHLYQHNKLPTKSLFDPSIFYDDNTSGEMFLGESVFNKINENPIMFSNIFQRPEKFVQPSKTSPNSSSSLPWSASHTSQSEGLSLNLSNDVNSVNSKQTTRKLYCSIIIYGFNDEHFSSLIEHFAKYGKIMEDLSISDTNYYYGQLGNLLANDRLVDPNDKNLSKNNINNFPIFLGNGWIKITYNNPNSAIRALVDNGTDDGKGNVLGVMPYRREALELLLGSKLSDELNIGDGLRGLSYNLGLESNFADNEIGRLLSKSLSENHLNGSDTVARSSNTTNIKDGSRLLLKNAKNIDEQTLLHKGIGFLFGKGEI